MKRDRSKPHLFWMVAGSVLMALSLTACMPSGLPGKTPGDMYVQLKVTLPPADNDKARELYRQMQAELGFNPRSKMEVS